MRKRKVKIKPYAFAGQGKSSKIDLRPSPRAKAAKETERLKQMGIVQ